MAKQTQKEEPKTPEQNQEAEAKAAKAKVEAEAKAKAPDFVADRALVINGQIFDKGQEVKVEDCGNEESGNEKFQDLKSKKVIVSGK